MAYIGNRIETTQRILKIMEFRSSETVVEHSGRTYKRTVDASRAMNPAWYVWHNDEWVRVDFVGGADSMNQLEMELNS